MMGGTKHKYQILKSIWVLMFFSLKDAWAEGCVQKDSLCIEGECRPYILCANQTYDLLREQLRTQVRENYWCTNLYFHLAICDSQIPEITQNIFGNVYECALWSLILTNDHITSISENAFSHFQIRILDLSFNEIVSTKIQANAFDNLRYLRILNISYNQLESIHKDIFKGLESLEKLYLNNNCLKYIEDGAFRSLTNLRYLYFNNNRFQTISKNTLLGLKNLNLAVLRLDNNNIKEIEPFAFDALNFNKKEDTTCPYPCYNALYLNNNNITLLINYTFDKIQNLVVLQLDDNNMNNIETGTFTGLDTLKILKLNNNNLHTITENLFEPLQNLEILDLTNNKIISLNSESFFGLANLKNMEMSNNQIKQLPLGTLKNFPLLENLQFADNALSQFRIGTFSNLGKLKYLNFSSNKFSTLNESVLYPLGSLELLDLDNNSFSHINSTSLLSHLPLLRYVSVNDNNWTCEMLTHMLKTFRAHNVNYLFNASSRYTEENVDGIFCTEIHSTITNINHSERNEPKTNLNQNFGVLIPLIKNISDVLNEKDFYATGSSVENKFSSLYVTLIFILLFLICLCVMLLYIIYRQYFVTIRNEKLVKETYSEIELLHAST